MSSHCIILFIKMLTRKFVVRRTASIPATVLRTNQSHVTSRQHLRSATRQSIVVPRHQLSSYGRRAFCVAGPSVWNFVPDSLRDPIIGRKSFRQSLKTFLFATYWCIQRIGGFTTMRYINRLFTYLLCDTLGLGLWYKCVALRCRHHNATHMRHTWFTWRWLSN